MYQKSKKTIIGFCGRLNSGKSILSKAMVDNYGAEIVTVASALKQLICDMRPYHFPDIDELNRKKRAGFYLSDTITDDDIHFISQETNVPYGFVHEKCIEKDGWGSVRDIMQFIGTEIIRKYNPNWHVEKLKDNIQKSSADYICVDDVRFPNERKAVELLGGECFFIIRPQSEVISNHSSETSIRWQDFDPSHIIINEVPEEIMKDCFIELFTGPFRSSSDCPILLSGNEYYTKYNDKFGIEHDELVDEVVEQNKDTELFRKHGVITYYTTDFTKRVKFTQRVLGSSRGVDYCRNKFIFYNPLIYENLKFYLE